MASGFRYLIFYGALSAILLSGCSKGRGHADLDAFVERARAQPAGEIEPLPVFASYAHFSYSAMALRSPFDAPFSAEELADGARAADAPDESRRRELLENFNFASLSLRGSLRGADGVQWALINDGSGGIHRVAVGNYLGRNHGRIIVVTEDRVDIVETVPDGRGGWLERPRTLALE